MSRFYPFHSCIGSECFPPIVFYSCLNGEFLKLILKINHAQSHIVFSSSNVSFPLCVANVHCALLKHWKKQPFCSCILPQDSFNSVHMHSNAVVEKKSTWKETWFNCIFSHINMAFLQVFINVSVHTDNTEGKSEHVNCKLWQSVPAQHSEQNSEIKLEST